MNADEKEIVTDSINAIERIDSILSGLDRGPCCIGVNRNPDHLDTEFLPQEESGQVIAIMREILSDGRKLRVSRIHSATYVPEEKEVAEKK